MVHRLKQSEIAKVRTEMLAQQGGKCALCGDRISDGEAALDHCHKTGHIRGVLHRGCNAALGHVENNAPRYKLTNVVRLTRWLRSIPSYIYRDYSDQPLHYTFRTEEEKRIRRNLKARKARAAKKEL